MSGRALAAVVLALAAGGCGGDAGSSEADRVERLLLGYMAADPAVEADLGAVERADCEPIGDVEHEGRPAFYCEVGSSDGTVLSLCVARSGERLFFSGGKVMCSDPFELAYPNAR